MKSKIETDDNFAALSKQLWRIGRSTKDPILKAVCTTIHGNIMLLRGKRKGDKKLHAMLIENLRQLHRRIGDG